MVLAGDDGDELLVRTQHSPQLGEPEVEVRYVVEHPGGDRDVERGVVERKPLDVADARVDAAAARKLDHPRREVDELHARAQIARDALCQLARPAADLEEAARLEGGDRLEQHLTRIRTIATLVNGLPR